MEECRPVTLACVGQGLFGWPVKAQCRCYKLWFMPKHNNNKKNTEGHKIGGFVAKYSVCVSANNCELFISWKPLRASVPPHVEQNAI